MNLSEDGVIQALMERLGGLTPGDKVIVEKVEDGFRVYSEFQEVRSENIKVGIKHKYERR